MDRLKWQCQYMSLWKRIMLGCWVVLLSQGVTQVLLQPLRNQMGNVFPEAQGVGTSDVAYEWQREEPLQLTLPFVPMHNDLLKWPSTQPLTPTTYTVWLHVYREGVHQLPIILNSDKDRLLYNFKRIPLGSEMYIVGRWVTQLGPVGV
ncbi:MAG: hypothetical protein AAFY70_07770, partial [Bacteroidota bacterium]